MLHNIIKFWLSFSRREQLALIVLSALIFIVLIIRLLASTFISPPAPDLSKAAMIAMQNVSETNALEITDMDASSDIGYVERERPSIKLTPFPFDPNTADEETLKALGLRPEQVKNILNYRGKGGKFRTAADFGRLFSISKDEHEQLAPYINISQESSGNQLSVRSAETIAVRVRPALNIVDLNEVDSIALLSLPGSGPWTAHRILKYRQLLGGFVKPEQLLEVRGIDSLKFEAMKPWVQVKAASLTPLRINFMDFRDLIKHPYLSFDQVKSIVNQRDRRGFIRHPGELLQLEHFSTSDLERLQPYLRFD